MKDTGPCGNFSKSAVRTASHTSHGGIISKRTGDGWAVNNTGPSCILAESYRLGRASRHAHPCRIISKEVQGTVLDADIVVSKHGRRRRTQQNASVCGIVSKVGSKA